MAFHPTKNLVASCSYDNSVKLWYVDTGAELWTVRGHSAAVSSVCFSSDGKELTSGSDDSTVRNWDPATRASLS